MDLFFNWAAGSGFHCFLVLATGSSLILAIGFIASVCLRNKSAACRFDIWHLTFLGLLIFPAAMVVLPEIRLGISGPDLEINTVTLKGPASRPLLDRDSGRTERRLPDSAALMGQETYREPSVRPQNAATPFNSTPSSSDFAAEQTGAVEKITTEATSLVGTKWYRMIKSVFVITWLLGVIWMLGKIVYSLCGVSRMRSQSVDLSRASTLKGALNLGRTIEVMNVPDKTTAVRISSDTVIPLTIGVFSPCILVPESAARWTTDRLRMVLKHESAHVARRDVLWQLLAGIAKALFWFQPMAWMAERKMQLERERACDDLVINQDEDACDYASLLLGYAAEVSPHDFEFAGALSIAQKPIERRLKTILEPSTPRGVSGRPFRWTVTLLAISILILVSTVRPFGRPVAAASSGERVSGALPNRVLAESASNSSLKRQGDAAGDAGPTGLDETPSEKQVDLPEALTGLVVDHLGNPVSGARVEFVINLSERKPNAEQITVTLPPAVSNADGEYTLDTKGIKAPYHTFHIYGKIFADQLPSTRYGYRINEVEKTTLPVAKFVKGKKIVGRVLAPAAANGAVAEPVHRVVRAANDAVQQFWRDTVDCDSEGRFEIYAPATGITDMIVEAENYAPTRVAIPQSESEAGDIVLSPGTEVVGYVGYSGKPASGVSVVITRKERINPSTWATRHPAMSIRSIVKTDDRGGFRFPPHFGVCNIAVVRSTGEASSNELPVVRPLIVDLSVPSEPISVSLVEGETFLVSGTIRWEDGTPQSGVEVTASSRAGNAHSRLGNCRTDASGKYEFRFPAGLDEILISARAALGRDGQWYYAYEKKIPLSEAHRSVSARIKDCTQDIVGVDWELRLPDPRKQRTLRERGGGDFAFDELDKRFWATWKSAWATAKSSERPSNTVDIQRDNAEKYVAELMELEKTYRGEFTGLLALKIVIGWGQDDSSPNAAAASISAWDILSKFYVEHSDIDMMINSMVWYQMSTKQQQFVDAIRRDNPNEHVQAALLFKECQMLSDLIVWHNQSLNGEQKYQSEEWSKRVKSADPVDLTAKLHSVIAELEAKYPGVDGASFVGEVLTLRIRRTYLNQKGGGTFAAKAKTLLFRAEKLAPGQTVPEIEGNDVMGKPFRLSDLQGKVVLLHFSAEWGPSTKIYDTVGKLKDKHKGQPFEIVTIMMDRDQKTAQEPVVSGQINWPTVWDGPDRPIAYQWDATSLPSTVYLIDHRGVINALMSERDSLDEIVGTLVADAMTDRSEK